MLIIEIALGVVLGGLILRYFKQVLAVAGVGLVVAVAAGLVALCGYLIWRYWDRVAVFAVLIIVLSVVSIGSTLGGIWISNRTRLTTGEGAGLIVFVPMLGLLGLLVEHVTSDPYATVNWSWICVMAVVLMISGAKFTRDVRRRPRKALPLPSSDP